MAWTPIDYENWPRREHFEYYTNVIKTNYQINVELDVTKLRKRCKKLEVRFYPTMIYAIMKAVNEDDHFRMALGADGKPGIYDVSHPNYTIFHKDDETFSDIWTEWNEDYDTFYEYAVSDMETYKNEKGIKTKPGRPDAFVSISCLPWLSFTSVCHDTTGPGPMYFPIIVFGKYHKVGEKWMMPFSLMINHAAADGFHTSRLLNRIQEIISDCKKWMV